MKFILAVAVVAIVGLATASATKTTAQRIADYNYPVETHQVQTSDGYVLTMFRIPYSPILENEDEARPVIFLQHGLLSSSDCWILNGPNDALAFVLVDAGYDVWMGNARGNTYSKEHVTISPVLPSFWDFSWHEIAIKDMPVMIDYALLHSNQEMLHYVGHSQGTTVFFVLMSSIPSYNTKIKTSHMLAPIAFMEHMATPLAAVLGPLLGNLNLLSALIGSNEFLPSTQLFSMLGSVACQDASLFQPICSNILFLIGGWDSEYLNYTLLPDVMETHTAGSSANQLIHYLQEHQSGYFRQFDHGIMNLIKYGQLFPPNYSLGNVLAATYLYYSDNDLLAAVVDVQKLEGLLPNVVESFHIPIPEWNHFDFLWALPVKEIVNDRIIATANQYEETGTQ